MAIFSFTTVTDTTGPEIVPESPLADAIEVGVYSPIRLAIGDGTGVDLATVELYVDGVQVYASSAAQSGATVAVTVNTGNGYDFEVQLAGAMSAGSVHIVTVYASDTLAQGSTFLYSFYTGISPRLVAVDNPVEGVLIPRFNEPMTQDATFTLLTNYTVTPQGSAEALVLLAVEASTTLPDAATLTFEGGTYGGTYELTVIGVTDLLGTSIDTLNNTATFTLPLPTEANISRVHLFDTVWGPMGMTQRVIKRRTVDNLVVGRSIAMAVEEQLTIRLKRLGAAIPYRGGKEGKNRT